MIFVAQKWGANKTHCSCLPYLVIIEQFSKPIITIGPSNICYPCLFEEVLMYRTAT